MEEGQDYNVADQNVGSYGGSTPTDNTVDWRSSFPPELQQAAARFNSPEALMKAYIGAESLIGKKVSDFAREDWQTYAAMKQEITNIPAEANGYNIDIKDPNTNCLSEDDLGMIKDLSHNLGLNTKQAQALYETLNEYGMSVAENALNQIRSSYEELARRWGNAAESKLKAVDHCVNNIFPKLMGCSSDMIIDALQGVWNSPLLMDCLAKIGELGTDTGSMGYNNLSPTDAGLRLEQMKADPRTAKILMNPQDPMHNQVKQEFRTLLSMKR